jgi:hypothetical protein
MYAEQMLSFWRFRVSCIQNETKLKVEAVVKILMVGRMLR